MVDLRARLTRRTALVTTYTLAVGLLLEAVRSDLAWVDATLANLGSILPETVRLIDDPALFALLALALLAGILAVGAFLVSPRNGTGFGLLSAASLAWILFPYARIPWASTLGGPTNTAASAPAPVWLLAGAVTLLATIEIALSARHNLLAEVDRLGIPTDTDGSLEQATRSAQTRWLSLSAVVSIGAVLAFAALRDWTQDLIEDPDLLWVPALAGLVGGVALWLWARE